MRVGYEGNDQIVVCTVRESAEGDRSFGVGDRAQSVTQQDVQDGGAAAAGAAGGLLQPRRDSASAPEAEVGARYVSTNSHTVKARHPLCLFFWGRRVLCAFSARVNFIKTCKFKFLQVEFL